MIPYFNSRSPCGERSHAPRRHGGEPPYFNSRSPCGERYGKTWGRIPHMRFQLTLPMRGAIVRRLISSLIGLFQLTLPMRGAMHRGDGARHILLFQLTLPMRGAMRARASMPASVSPFQLTLPMRGAIQTRTTDSTRMPISTHAPHAGSDGTVRLSLNCLSVFQLTLPMRGAIDELTAVRQGLEISTHAPHAGSDKISCGNDVTDDISTHAPHAGSDARISPADDDR